MHLERCRLKNAFEMHLKRCRLKNAFQIHFSFRQVAAERNLACSMMNFHWKDIAQLENMTKNKRSNLKQRIEKIKRLITWNRRRNVDSIN